MISVIIPAHNEENVIRRTLTALVDGTNPGEIEVIVVCNGCSDRTACEAGTIGEPVRVLETAIAGKAHALNLGDQAARGFPRVFLDADVLLPLDALRQLARCLDEGSILAAAPTASFDVTGCSWAVRAYYSINGRLPSSREGIGGSGVYALSERGRTRFGPFPEITADDLFVRLQFGLGERHTLPDSHSTVFAPKCLSDLIAIKTRSHFGGYELHRKFPEKWPNRGCSNGSELLRLWKDPLLWAKLTVYCYVKLISRLRAQRRLRRGLTKVWERDQSSRQMAHPQRS
jgi:glycosyltransferase involved in cell wall biosynthesis